MTIQVARSLNYFNKESQELLLTFLFAGPLTLVVVVGGGYFLARRALAPVAQMAHYADEITVDRLNQRITVANPDDELGALAQTLNGMIERLDRSFADMQRFTADAAHELRTPLAIMRNEAEIALRAGRSTDEYARVLGDLLEEMNRMSQITEQLLFLSRQDAKLHVPATEEVDIHQLVAEVVSNMELVAQEKGVRLILSENPTCRVTTDPSQVRRVLYNLLDNALKYTPSEGQVTVSAKLDFNHWVATITDTGIGIPPEHLPHVFDRFYRVDASRAIDDGSGLGLAICQSIMTGLVGTITLDSGVGVGTRVVVQLPC